MVLTVKSFCVDYPNSQDDGYWRAYNSSCNPVTFSSVRRTVTKRYKCNTQYFPIALNISTSLYLQCLDFTVLSVVVVVVMSVTLLFAITSSPRIHCHFHLYQ